MVDPGASALLLLSSAPRAAKGPIPAILTATSAVTALGAANLKFGIAADTWNAAFGVATDFRDVTAVDDQGNVTVPGDQAAAHAFIAMLWFYQFAYDIAYTPLLVSYTVEILPHQIRAKGVAVMK